MPCTSPRLQALRRSIAPRAELRRPGARTHPMRSRWSMQGLAAALVVLPATSLGTPLARAQELPLKREIPGAFRCAEDPADRPPTAEERTQATRLGASAAEAVILGNRERAEDLLARAVELDPTAPDLAYQYARILEELGEGRDAVTHYCRVLALDAGTPDAADARDRIDELTAADRPDLPPLAIAAFRAGLARADDGRLTAALDAFGRAVAAAPDWPEAVYDRGVVLARSGRRDEAVADLRRYLQLRPGASDAMAVSERIGRLENAASAASPGTALTLGILLPGMGQFYSGRVLGGLTVLSLVGGSVAAALLIEEVQVLCLVDPGPDGTCPDGQVLSEEVDRPYLVTGLGAAAAVSLIGALEAFIRLRGRRGTGDGPVSVELGGAKVTGPHVVPFQGRVDIRVARLSF